MHTHNHQTRHNYKLGWIAYKFPANMGKKQYTIWKAHRSWIHCNYSTGMPWQRRNMQYELVNGRIWYKYVTRCLCISCMQINCMESDKGHNTDMDSERMSPGMTSGCRHANGNYRLWVCSEHGKRVTNGVAVNGSWTPPEVCFSGVNVQDRGVPNGTRRLLNVWLLEGHVGDNRADTRYPQTITASILSF